MLCDNNKIIEKITTKTIRWEQDLFSDFVEDITVDGKKVDVVDFQRMESTFAQQTYKTVFPKTSSWFKSVNDSNEFKYIEAINNRTKHTADIANKLSMGILGSSNKAEIGPFLGKQKSPEDKNVWLPDNLSCRRCPTQEPQREPSRTCAVSFCIFLLTF